MTRKEMEQCISLRHEIESIEAAIKSPKSTYVVVFYKDYRTGKGIPKAKQEVDHGEHELALLKSKLTARKAKLAKRLREAADFIDEIDDSMIRTIFTKRYLEGVKQKEIAKQLNYSEPRVSQLINAFWAGQEERDRRKSK